MSTSKIKPVYVVDGSRTPFIKSKGKPGPFSASDMAVYAGRDLLTRVQIDPTLIGESIIGCMMPSEREANIGRLIGLRLGLGDKTPGWTVQRNCASGMQSLDSAVKDIQTGRHDLVLAGGTEAMSRAPLTLRPKMAAWLADLNRAKTPLGKLGAITKLKLSYLAPIITLIHGLTDPIYGVNMGQTAEILAYDFDITRQEMDEFALRSQLLAAKATEEKLYRNMVAMYDPRGGFYDHDTGVRPDSSIEALAKLKPFFDRKFGRVTAGNSSQISDGAAILLLASEAAVAKHNLNPIGKIVDVEWGALSPEVMGLGPVIASTPMLQRHGLGLNDIDYWEINEAFAAQVLGCLRAWESDAFCQKHFSCDALGSLDQKRLNVEGGAIALGHPVGATGSRLILQLLDILKRNNAQRGIATLCIGGGQGGAMMVESV